MREPLKPGQVITQAWLDAKPPAPLVPTNAAAIVESLDNDPDSWSVRGDLGNLEHTSGVDLRWWKCDPYPRPYDRRYGLAWSWWEARKIGKAWRRWQERNLANLLSDTKPEARTEDASRIDKLEEELGKLADAKIVEKLAADAALISCNHNEIAEVRNRLDAIGPVEFSDIVGLRARLDILIVELLKTGHVLDVEVTPGIQMEMQETLGGEGLLALTQGRAKL